MLTVQTFIKEHFVWQNLFFWEEYFWDFIADSFGKRFGKTNEFTDKHKDFVKIKLVEFAQVVQEWGK